MRQVTHALLTRPPLSQIELQTEVICPKCFVRLACVKHAASVHPEPGSNSLVMVCPGLINSSFNLSRFTWFRSEFSRTHGRFPGLCSLNFQGLCIIQSSIVKVLFVVAFLGDSLYSISCCF